ncbi:mediator of DNA damage checkpoint protein 1 isoform X4 [Choloepus didactylus]|uniref:mediator of DNA damage checkpoint protein 1 isoform X4 n=1 Tax=Choloepus didactylus TaxID=27675 RepID=UPI00189D7323|nr:mediator of DNA damage checkpoint protein 1 isoform X4 [Choloepus didactylus]
MEDTQVIDWEADEEEEAERPSESLGCNLEPLGRLHIFSSVHGPEKDFPLYLGKNVVGRMPDCSVALPFPSISKQHAVIEILALDKAPVLHDCGSLNGTQIVRPPKVLSPGVSHRLRDQELILFADLPCQYHHLDVPPPLVSRAPLTVEETPRVQAGTRPQGLLLAEDSEEEVDLLSESCVVKESRSVSSPLATVVPESDEEGASPAPDGPGPPFAFNLESDTDEECEQPASGEASSAARRGATAEADGVATELHLEKNQPSAKEVDNETKVESATGNVVLPVGVILKRNQPIKEDSDTDVDDDNKLPGRSAEVHLERNQPSAFTDSDTDVEEEGIPATPAMVPVKKRQIFRGVGMESLGVPALAHLQESQASRDIDVEKGEAPLAVPLERSQPPVVINSDTDDEEEISAALALSLLKESRIVTRNRDIDVGEGRAQPVVLLEESQTSAGRDSDTDMEEEGLPVEKRHLPKGHTDKDGVLVIAHSEKSQPPLGDSDMDVVEKDLPGIQLERRQTSTMVDINTVVEEEVPPGPAVTHLEKHQVPEEGTNQTDVEAEGNPAKLPVVHLEEAQLPPDCEMDAEESMSLADSAVADVRKLQLPAEGDAGTEWAAAVLERERALEAGAQGGSLVTQVEQELLPVSRENLTDLVVGTSTSGEPIQPHREGAQTPTEREREPHVHGSKDSEDNQDDSEDLDLQATQCFVERENQSLESVQDMEDEPTQAFRITLPQEAGPSCCSFYTSGALDEPWEVLATQPFCLREAEASETQHIATHLEAHGTSPSPPRATPQDQQPESPVHTEPLGIQIRGAHTMEKDMEPPIPRTRQHGSQQAPETPMSSELEPLRTEPKVRPRGSSRMTPSPVPSTALEPRSTTHLTYQPISPEPASQVIRGRTRRSSEMTPVPVVPTAIELQPSTSTDQPVTPEPKLQTTWGRTHRSSVKTPEPVESTTPDIQPVTPRPILRGTRGRTHRSSVKTPEPVESRAPHPEPPTPTDQPVNPEPMLRATRGRARRSSVKTPEPVIPTAPELQPSTSTDQPVNPEPRLRATRGRARRSSVKTPEPVIPTAPELQPSTSTDQPVNPEPILRATRGRTHRSTVKTPEPVESAVPHLKPPTSTDQPVNPEPRLRATRGRAHRSSVKTPETVIPTAPELQPSTSTDQPVNPEPMLRATRGRARRSSVKTPEPVIPTASEPQPSTSTDQPVNPEPVLRATRGRTHRSTVKTPEPVESTVSHLKPPTPTDQPVTPEPMLQATRGRARRSSVKTPEPVVPTAPELHPSTSTDQPVTPESIAQGGQNRTLRSSSINALPVPTTPEFQPPVPTDQPIPPEPVPQASCSRRQRTTKKHGSLTAPIVNEPCSIPESKSCSSRSQRRGAVRATESFMTIPEPSFPQLLEAPPHALPIQKVEVTGISGSTPESQPKASRNRKRPLVITDSSPLQKQSQRREGPQKAESLKKEEETAERPRKEEDAVVPGLGKRKRGQAEEEPKETLSHNLRRIKTDQEPTVPRVLFTGVVDARGERAVLALGGSLAGSVTEASHLVTDRIRRTVKFLCALGRGIPILTLDWLHQSRKAGCFLPPEEYVVTDPEQERNFGFSLRDALSRARERRLLEGYEIHVTPGVQPPPPQMGEIISCCGGTVLPSMPRSYKPHRVVITCPQDFPRCSIPFRVGLPLLSPEFLLTGVLKQEAKPEAFILSSLEMSST